MKIRFYITFASVFVLGMLCGGVLALQITTSRVQNLVRSSTKDVSEQIIRKLHRELDLSSEQRINISNIFTEAVQEAEPMRAEMRSRALQIIDKYKSLVGQQLTPEQRDEFYEMVEGFKDKSNLDGSPERNRPE